MFVDKISCTQIKFHISVNEMLKVLDIYKIGKFRHRFKIHCALGNSFFSFLFLDGSGYFSDNVLHVQIN